MCLCVLCAHMCICMDSTVNFIHTILAFFEELPQFLPAGQCLNSVIVDWDFILNFKVTDLKFCRC